MSNLLAKIITLLFSLSVALVFCEFAVRIYFRDITTTGDNRSYFAQKWRKENVRLNSSGFRNKEISAEKPHNTFRIAVIGDSFAFGQGIKEEERFSNIIERELAREWPDKNFEVINFGKPGHETVDHIETFKTYVRNVHADYLVYQWYMNDFEGKDKTKRPREIPLVFNKTLHEKLLKNSAFYFLLDLKGQDLIDKLGLSEKHAHYIHRRFADPQSNDSIRALKELETFVGLCKENNIPLFIVLFPNLRYLDQPDYPFDYLHKRVLDLCTRKGVLSVDLRGEFLKVKDTKELRVNAFDSHASPLANSIAAETLLARLHLSHLSLYNSPRSRSKRRGGRSSMVE